MFGFLKKKLGEVISRFSEKAREEPEEEAKKEQVKVIEKKAEEKPLPKPVQAARKADEVKAEVKPREKEKEEKKDAKEEIREEPKKPKSAQVGSSRLCNPAEAGFAAADWAQSSQRLGGFFERITSAVTEAVTTTKISETRFEELFRDLEITLLENNVAVEAIDKIKADLKGSLVEKPLQRGKIEETIRKTLRGSVEDLFTSGYDLKEKVKEIAAEKKPAKLMFVGINGSGKTTTIAKMAKMLQDSKLKVAIAASDTFRAAAIHQLQEHADKLGVKLIKHDYGADPAAVAFDAIKYAEAHGIDAVLIDTAGRLHSNVNLMAEMEKVARVAKPDMKIFVGEAITGNDCVEQARKFNEAIGIDGIILAKADVDEKGGAAISVSYVTKKPIFYLGTGQGYNDLAPFSAEAVVESLGLAA
ncbi:signal recognition particle-docking protein FtsY [Candidatus Woesearchaeota archaeon]|nr:signal recognition particle-docking protein FtsY [Candidatus Woesearchaeota archaeon]